MSSKVLIVEDEMDIGRLLYMQVENMGYQPEHVSSGEEALALLNRNHYDLMLLDWMLPGLSGIEIAQLVRKMDSMKDLAILMLTAKSDPDNIVEGLEAGADDYIAKPFSTDILKARMASLLRRVKRGDSVGGGPAPQEDSEEIKIGPLKVSLKTYKASINGQPISLTPSEFKLLSTMLQYRGRVLTRQKLIEEVQGEGISVIGRTIDTHVFGLRKKLGEHSDMIETVRGIGYRVRDDLFQ
jgi:two-component system phosphate regulon response regulator PhoB